MPTEGRPIATHVCPLPRPLRVGERYTCACGVRYVAVRQRLWSRRARWERVLFTLPDLRCRPLDADDGDGPAAAT